MLKQLAVILVLTWVIVASSWSLFHPSFFHVHDYVHGARIAEMSRALSDGHFPPRWSENFGYGYGMPLFEFYAPLPYYVGAAFYLIGLPLVLSVKLIFFLSSFLIAIGSYKLGAKLYGRSGGLLVAAAITLAPYRAVNLFVRGALSETWAITAVVWLLFFCTSYMMGKTKSWTGIVISASALFLSHNIVTLLSAPYLVWMIVVLGFVLSLKIKQLQLDKDMLKMVAQRMLGVFGSVVLAAGISSYYLLPAYLEKDFTKLEQFITGGYFDYQLHFLYVRQFFVPFWGYGGSGWGPDDGMSFFLGFGQLIGLSVLAFLCIKFLFRSRQQRISSKKYVYIGSLWLTVVGLLFFATQKSQFLWQSLELLKFIQFPWRTLSLAVISIGLLIGSIVLFSKSFIKRWMIAGGLILLLLGNAWYFRPKSWLDNPSSLYYSDAEKIREDMSSVLPDYIPSQLSDSLPVADFLVDCSNCEVEVQVNRTHQKLIAFKSSQETLATFSIAAYPGWFAEIDGVKKNVAVSPSGLLQLEIPKGAPRVGLVFGETEIRLWADWLSFSSVVIFLAIYLYTGYDKRTL